MKKSKKNIIALVSLFLIVTMCLSMVGCNKDEQANDNQKETQSTISDDEVNEPNTDSATAPSEDDNSETSKDPSEPETPPTSDVVCEKCNFRYLGDRLNGSFSLTINGHTHSHGWSSSISEGYAATNRTEAPNSIKMSSDSATPAMVLKTHGLIGVQDEFSDEPCPKCNIPIKYCVSCVSFEEFDRLNKEDWYLIQTHEIVGVSNRHSEEPCHKCNIPIKYCLACVTMEEYDRMLTENHNLSSVWINRSESKNTSFGENFAQGDSFGENTSENITQGTSENKKDECGYTKTDNGYFIICPVTGEKHIVTFE